MNWILQAIEVLTQHSSGVGWVRATQTEMLILVKVDRARETARGTNKQTMLTLVRVDGASEITRDKQTNKQTNNVNTRQSILIIRWSRRINNSGHLL